VLKVNFLISSEVLINEHIFCIAASLESSLLCFSKLIKQ
jgi:hypothetical protein